METEMSVSRFHLIFVFLHNCLRNRAPSQIFDRALNIPLYFSLLLTQVLICFKSWMLLTEMIFLVVVFSIWALNFIRTASYEITLVRLSVRPLLCFLKIASLVFSDIVHYDRWPRYPVTDEIRFLKKKLAARIWAKWTKLAPETRFFAIFSSLVHLFFFKLNRMIA